MTQLRVAMTMLFALVVTVCGNPTALAETPTTHPKPVTPSKEQINELLRAAKQGDPDAQFQLANEYHFGNGVPKDNVQAIHWYQQAAEQGHAAAQFSLSVQLYLGVLVPQDKDEAIYWLQQSAEGGYPGAQLNSGAHYFDGRDGPIDYVQAYSWWILAAASTQKMTAKRATKNLALAEKIMTNAQIEAARESARKYVPKKSNHTSPYVRASAGNATSRQHNDPSYMPKAQ